VIHRWVLGEVAAPTEIAESRPFADDLADFLLALQRIESAGGPPPGVKNFHRGGHLSNYDGELREAIRLLGPRIDGSMITRHWEAALDSEWSHPPVWTHGDIAIGNLLARNGRLAGVIDFGGLAVGDPACDLSIAWTVFRGEGRKAFRSRLPLDAETWRRARAWTLWKGVVLAAGCSKTSAAEWSDPWRVIGEASDGGIEIP